MTKIESVATQIELAVQEERAACAQIAESYLTKETPNISSYAEGQNFAAERIAEAIRERKGVV